MTDSDKPTVTSSGRRVYLALIPLIVAALAISLSAIGVVGQKVVRMEALTRVSANVAQILPQGWSFFTKAPQTPRYILYTFDGDEYVNELAQYSVDHTSLYGWNRTYRNTAAERELVERILKDENVTACDTGDIADCFSGLDISNPEYSVDTFTIKPRLCGAFFVAVAEPVPWAWRDLVDDQLRVTGVTTLEISC